MNIYEDGLIVTFEDGSEALISTFPVPTIITAETEYVVGQNETLFSISAKLFKDSSLWFKIAEVNNVADPLEPEIGLSLKIPLDA